MSETRVSINGVEIGSLREVSERLQRVIGGDAEAVDDTKERIRRFSIVERGPEMDRILELRRRPILDPTTPYAHELAQWMTRRMARTQCPYPMKPGQYLFPTQALAIRELIEEGRLAGPIRAGGGKMLLAYLLFAVLKAKRPLYMLPKSMQKDTEIELLKYSADWHGPPASRISYLSYQRLSSPSSAERTVGDTVVKVSRLDALAPDVIVMDEGHMISRGSIGYKRLMAYAQKNPSCTIIPISGSMMRTSMNDSAHLLWWALGDLCPVPNDWDERQQWAGALDEKSGWGARTEIGDLVELMNGAEEEAYNATMDPDEQRMIICSTVGRWILETPGVVGSQDGPLGIPLTMHGRFVRSEDAAIEEAIKRLVEGDRAAGLPKASLPNGERLVDWLAVGRARHTMNLGFWQEQDPPPPDEYKFHRKEWVKKARDRLKNNGRGIDSEVHLIEAIEAGEFKDLRTALGNWKAARALYTATTGHREPPSAARWFSDEVFGEVERWLEEVGTGLVWVNYIDLGKKIAERLGIPYFGAKKLDGSGRHITKMKKGEPCVVSIDACGTGTNLQHFHSKNLWLGSPREQPLARTHRPGQDAERVENYVYLPGRAQLERYWKQHDYARLFAQPMTRQAQRLCYAVSDVPTIEGACYASSRLGSYRWKTLSKKVDADE